MQRMGRRRIFSPLLRSLLAALYGGFAIETLAQKQFRQLSRLPIESQSLLSQHYGYKDKRVSEAYIWTTNQHSRTKAVRHKVLFHFFFTVNVKIGLSLLVFCEYIPKVGFPTFENKIKWNNNRQRIKL